MSRVGNRPIKIESDVTCEIQDNMAVLTSSRGKIEVNIPKQIKVSQKDGEIKVERQDNSKYARSQHGLVARLIENGIDGLSHGVKKVLEFKGTGYRARLEEDKLILGMGYSHDVEIGILPELEVSIVKNSITVSGYDAAMVGNLAAEIRAVRPPEVYKGKGIKYQSEYIKRKDGKIAAAGKG